MATRKQTALPKAHGRSHHEPSSHNGFAVPDTRARSKQLRKDRNATITDTPLHVFRSNTIETTSASKVITAESVNRRYMLLQNVGTSTIFLGFGIVASTNGNNSMQLPPGTQIDFSNGIVPSGDISAASSGNGRLAILEGHLKT